MKKGLSVIFEHAIICFLATLVALVFTGLLAQVITSGLVQIAAFMIIYEIVKVIVVYLADEAAGDDS